MKRFLHVSAGVCLFLLSIAAVPLAGGPTTVTFQGLLTDDNGDPVKDSTYTVSAGLWGQIIGGSNLNDAELHVVPTKNGVFTIELNESGHFFDSCAPCDAWLEIQVLGPGGFEALSPRTHLAAVPHALTSTTFHSETSSGAKEARGRVRVLLAPDYIGHKLELSADEDGDGVPEFASLDSATTKGVRRLAVGDFDGDGLPDVEAGLHVEDDGSTMHLRSYDGTHFGYGSADMTTSDSGAALDLTYDDGSGKSGLKAKNIRKNISVTLFKSDKKHAARMAVDSGLSEMVLETDLDGDSIPEHSVRTRVHDDRALLGLKNYDPLLAYTPGDDVTLQSDDSSSSIELSRQSSPDELTISVGDSESAVRAAKHTPNQEGYSNFVLAAHDSGSVLGLSHVDADGESDLEVKAIRKNITVNLRAHPTKGPVAHFGCDSVRALTYVEADPDEDGDQSGVRAEATEPRSILETYFASGSSQSRVMDSADADGAHTSAQAQSSGGGCTMQCDVGYQRAEFYVHRSVPEPGSTTMQVAEAVTIQTLPDTARLSITAGEVISGNHADGWSLLQADGTCLMQGTAGGRSSIIRCSDASCSMVMIDGTLGTDDTGLVMDGTGDGKIGLGVSNPTQPIEHSSGAHLTAGGVWTNASDAALKENFQSVDGRDLLERIDQLEITRWNYRTESDDVTHIGPTAQDFKHLFGVGSNDRSISTVDPSGIALAAIKELHKENDELRKQNLELMSRLEEMDRKLDRVLSRN